MGKKVTKNDGGIPESWEKRSLSLLLPRAEAQRTLQMRNIISLSIYIYFYIYYIHRLVNLVEARVGGGGVLEFLFTSAIPVRNR